MPIHNITQQSILAQDAVIADNPFKRMKGLLGREALNSSEALVITGCNSIHMLFMKFTIDVVFVDRNNRVVGLTPRIKPFQLSPVFWKSACAIELPAGTIEATRTCVGDQLHIS